LRASYFYGAPLRDSKVRYSVRRVTLPKFPGDSLTTPLSIAPHFEQDGYYSWSLLVAL